MSTVTCPECGDSNPAAAGRCYACGADLLALARAPRFGAVLSMVDVAEVTKVDSVSPDPLDTEERPLSQTERPALSDPLALAVDPPIVGRDAALESMRETIGRGFRDHKSALVVFEGERGLGKTRMLREAGAMALVKDPRTRILYAACREDGDGPYSPFSRLLLDRFRITPSTGPTAVRGQMATDVGEALDTMDASAVNETTHLLGHIAGVPFPGSPVLRALEGEPDLLRIRAGRALRRLLEGDARRAPTMLLLDNAHFAGTDGWALLDAVCQARRVPLVVVIAGGPGVLQRSEPLDPEISAQRFLLDPLDESEVAEALRGLLPTLGEVPEPLAAAAFHRSNGNPAALRELCFGLVDAGLFKVVGEDESLGPSLEVEIDRIEEGELPLNIDDVMRGRLARLDETERQTLRNAAVVGETCWDGLLLALARASTYAGVDIEAEPTTLFDDDQEARELEAVLVRLEEKGFLLGMEESDLAGSIEYCFRLPEMRELVAAEIPDSERRAKHALIARWLDLAAAGSQRSAVAALLATHYERAGERDRAARAYLEAARHERLQLRTTDAVRHLERAIAGLDPQDFAARLDALHEQGSLLALLGRYDEALTAFRSMLLTSWRLGAKSKAAAALNRIARIHRSRGEIAQALATLDRALRLFRACGDRRGIASCLDDLAQSRLLVGEYQRALDDAAEALELRRSLGDKRGEAVSLATVGQIELARGLLDAAEACFGQALEIRERAGDIEGLVSTHNHLGIVAFERGDRVSAETAWRAALERAREIGDRRMQSYILNNLGELAARSGRVDEAEPLLREAHMLAHEMADLRAGAEIERNLGLLLLKQGNLAEARQTLERALDLAEQFGSRAAVACAVRSLAECHAQTLFDGGEGTDGAPMAEQLLTKAAGLFEEIGSAKEAARTLADLGFHLLERGDVERARETLLEARRRMRTIGLPELAKVETTLAELG